MTQRKQLLKLLSYLFLIISSCVMAYPVLFLLVGSFINADNAQINSVTQMFMLFLAGMVMPQIIMLVPMYPQMAWFPFACGNNICGQGGQGFIVN